MEFDHKKILVVGLGISGISVSRWLKGAEADVTISDSRPPGALNQDYLEEAKRLGIEIELSGHRNETFVNSDIIIVSPGVPLDIEPLVAARTKNVPIIGEMEFASGLLDTPIIAVTGTNGKSTAVSLIGSIIQQSGSKVFVGGNIGTPLMDYVSGPMDADYVVAEVSSFQLDTMANFCPRISLLLNISPDHLDRYVDYDAYVKSKLRIFQNQTAGHYAVINDDDKILADYKPKGDITVLRYGMEKRENRHSFLDGKRLVAGLPGEKQEIFDVYDYSLPGRHNLENLMGAVLVGLALRLSPEVIGTAVRRFKGLPHRMEKVMSINDIEFYDDSKATNVDAALRSIKSFEQPLILIAGGRHKGGDYRPLTLAAKKRVKRVMLIGEAKDLMAKSFEGVIPFVLVDSMEEAVSRAFSYAEAGDVVLLAPACSSFDMFSDYAHRGTVFRREVERLANEK